MSGSTGIGHEILHGDAAASLHDVMYICQFSIIHYSLINVDKLDQRQQSPANIKTSYSLLVKPKNS